MAASFLRGVSALLRKATLWAKKGDPAAAVVYWLGCVSTVWQHESEPSRGWGREMGGGSGGERERERN